MQKNIFWIYWDFKAQIHTKQKKLMMNDLTKQPSPGIIKAVIGLAHIDDDVFLRIWMACQQLGYIFSDIKSAFRNDPALRGKVFGFVELLTYAGIWAIFCHRIAHLLYVLKIPVLPRILSQLSRLMTGIEIHPGAQIEKGFFIDHGNGVVIGETAEIGQNVLLYHQVTLGGTGQTSGKRHPTLGDNVVVGAGAKILGAVTIGENSRVGAGSIVVKDIPICATVVGNPGLVIKRCGEKTDLQTEKLEYQCAPSSTVDEKSVNDFLA